MSVKKVFVLFASPNKSGYTKMLLDAFTHFAPEKAVIETAYLYDVLTQPCTDCRVCKLENTCIFRDLDGIFDKMQSADLVLIATPVYHYNVPSPLKAVFDRMQRFFEAYIVRKEERQRQTEGIGVLLTVSGRKATEPVKLIQKQADKAFNLLGIRLSGSVHMPETDTRVDKEALKQAEDLGREIFENN